MQLLAAHQILIAAALGLALLFGARAGVLYARGGEIGNLALALGSLIVAAALGVYFRKLRQRWAKLREKR